jgi:DNA-binding transcriptional LysR family regulator
LGHGVLSTALSSFALRYPEVMLDVQFSDRIASLVDEGFDLAVRVGRPADSTLVARKLGQARLQVVASESYLAKRGVPLRPEDLTRHDCVIDTNIRDPLTWRFQDNGRPISVTVAGRIRYSTAEACIAAAEAGLGIAIGPDFATRPGLAAGRLRCVLESFVEEPMGIHVLYPPGRHLAAKVRAFVDFMVEYFRPNEPR